MIRNLSATKAVALLGLLSALVLAVEAPAVAEQAGSPAFAPQNPAFTQYLVRPLLSTSSVTTGGLVNGLVPEPLDLSYLSTTRRTQTAGIVSLPTSYDIRTLSKVTPIRNQGGCGSCWSFASYGSLESSLMPGVSWDGSENNLKNTHGFDISCCSGGNRTIAVADLSKMGGSVAEADDPYNSGSCYSPPGVVAKKRLSDVIFIPNRTGPTDNDRIKQAVMTYGAIYTTYYHSDSYYNSATYGYYYNGGGSSNHAVCIVGWDDNFDKSKFLTAPPGNGAFLIRNSWGTYWGQAGYFWMSYYDSNIGKENAAFVADNNPVPDTIYQYDPLGWISSTGYGSSTAWFANVFTATSNSSLTSAGWYCAADGASYELYVYSNPSGGPTSSAGPVATKTGSIASAGYHVISLDNPVSLSTGQKFSVVVKLTTPAYSYPIPVERPYGGYTSAATAAPGQSYMSSSGTSWTDVAQSYTNTNVCLKAFAGGSITPPSGGVLSVTPTTTFSASGTIGGPFSPATQAYSLTNTGGTTITWTTTAADPWVSLSSNSGTLDPGTRATVTATIDSSANSLAAGGYSSTITFTNSTNGSGNTTRPVSLTVNPPPTGGSLVVTPSTSLSASGAAGGPFSPGSATYTLTNNGGTAITWTAANTQAWLTLSSTGGTLNPGASASVTASINASANTLAIGSYTDTLSFVNTTNGTGNTTRPVSLSVSAVAPPPPSSGYKIVTATYSWIDPTSHTRLFLGDDSTSYALAMPFSFRFYGKAYKSIYVGSNGLAGFVNSGLSTSRNYAIPYVPLPNAAIYPYWDDLNPQSAGSIRYGTVGLAPNRQFVISWVGVPEYFASTAKITCQAILCEGSNDIIFQYQDVAVSNTLYGMGRSATVGIENETGAQAAQYSCNKPAISNNTAIRFTTSGSAVGNVPWRPRF